MNVQIETDLGSILTKLDQKLDNLENKLEGKIDNLENKLDQKLDNLENKLEGKIDNFENKLEGKIDSLHKEVTDMNVRLIKVETQLDSNLPIIKEDIRGIKTKQETLVNDVADLKGSKSLIVPIIVAITASILTLLIRAIPIS